MEAIDDFKQETFDELNFRVTLVTMMNREDKCSGGEAQETVNVAQVGNGS